MLGEDRKGRPVRPSAAGTKGVALRRGRAAGPAFCPGDRIPKTGRMFGTKLAVQCNMKGEFRDESTMPKDHLHPGDPATGMKRALRLSIGSTTGSDLAVTWSLAGRFR